VPAYNGLRLAENQRRLPPRPELPQDHLEQFILSGKVRLRMLLLQNGKLLPKRQILQEEAAARVDRPNE
jgi:hypothetical protein